MEKATREQTKFHNTQLVLKTIYRQGETHRADIARLTHLTRTTVSDIVTELLQEGLLLETGLGESAGGKPPTLIKFEENARQLICVELGKREVCGAVINLRGQICHTESICGDDLDGRQTVELLYELIDRLLKEAKAPIIGIGVAVPGLMDIENGMVRRSVQLDWVNVPLRNLLEKHYSFPIYLINDSHAAALAEYTYGELRQSPNLIVVRIVEGIGAGILLSGQLHLGDGYGAGEIGHLTVVEGGRQCTCGNYGCLETVASPRAVVQRTRELAEYAMVPYVKDAGLPLGEIDWDVIRRAFETGDETVVELIKTAGSYLGISIANLVSILNVHRIVISGSYGEFGDAFLNAVSAEVKRRSLINALETQIVNSSLDPDIILLGVSALVLSKEMGLP